MARHLRTKLRTSGVRVLIAGNDLLQGGLVTHDADSMVIHFHPVHHCLDVGLPEGDGSRGNIFPHQPAEALDRLGVEGVNLRVDLDALQRILRPVPVGLPRRLNHA